MAIRHKRDTDARPHSTDPGTGLDSTRRGKPRAALVAGPIAFLATASVVTLGVLSSGSGSGDTIATRDASSDVSRTVVRSREVVSRSESRRDSHAESARFQRAFDVNMARAATLAAVRGAHTKRWTTAPLNLWTAPGKRARRVGLLDSSKHVLVTGRRAAGRAEIVVDGTARWVTASYLAEDKPVVEKAATPSASSGSTGSSARTTTAGLSTAPCPDGSVENGLTSGAVLVYRAVCHAFPQITSYGGWDAHGEHASGKAIDIMTSDKALGDQIAAFLQSHASELGLYDVIWWDRIWTPVRAAEGWRAYGDHGSATANHMDHVHVSVN